MNSFIILQRFLKKAYLEIRKCTFSVIIFFSCALFFSLPKSSYAQDESTIQIQTIWTKVKIGSKEALNKLRDSKQQYLQAEPKRGKTFPEKVFTLRNGLLNGRHNPGSYWALISIPQDRLDTCICFGFDLKNTFGKFSKVTVFNVTEDSISNPKWTGNECNVQHKSLRFSKNCISIHDFISPTEDTLLLLVNLFNFRSYQNNLTVYFSQENVEIRNREYRIANEISRYAFAIAFCAILFFSFVYFFMQFMQSANEYRIQNSAYLWYSMFLLLTCVYHIEQIEWRLDLYGLFSHNVTFHYHVEVPLVTGIYLSYIYFFKTFFRIENKIALTIINYSTYFIFSLPLIDIFIRHFYGVHLAMVAYDYYRVFLFSISGFFFYYTFPSKRRDLALKEKKQTILKTYVFWGCFSLILGGLITVLFKIPALLDLQPSMGPIWGQELNFTRMGILLENLFFIAAFAYKQRLEVEKKEKLKIEKEESLRIIQLMQHQVNRSKIAEHTLTNIITIIETNYEKDKTLMRKVYAFVRNQYENSYLEKIDLIDELRQLKNYVVLQKLRMPNLEFEIQYHPKELKKIVSGGYFQVPPSFLYPYIENAIEHGLFPKRVGSRQLTLKIEEKENERIWYTIQDNGIGIGIGEGVKSDKTSTGISLSKGYLNSHNYDHKIERIDDATIVMGTRVKIFPLSHE